MWDSSGGFLTGFPVDNSSQEMKDIETLLDDFLPVYYVMFLEKFYTPKTKTLLSPMEILFSYKGNCYIHHIFRKMITISFT